MSRFVLGRIHCERCYARQGFRVAPHRNASRGKKSVSKVQVNITMSLDGLVAGTSQSEQDRFVRDEKS